ncbi:MAG TPA: fused MFS/spermidine synthase [Myxococcota bacterium]|nr:fused MFS/spermidine synthase [Myxococcota bacterium]
MTAELRLALVLVCFLLSGFAALLYQTVWTREFAFVFGTSELAVATVLAAYMAGLAGGAAVAGRLAHRVRRPVLAYGLLELGIALSALAVPLAVGASTLFYVALFGGKDAPPASGGAAQAVYCLVSSFAILFVPTALMGATLPMLARHAVRHEREIGARIGLLYATNTLGAVAGTLVAAFALLPRLGQQRTVLVGAALNAGVFATAAILARFAAPVEPGRAAEAVARARGNGAWILPAVLLSGICSFAYEVLWTRLLGHVLGGSVYAFATMLASFLIGIAVGSAVASRLARSPGRAARGFAVAQLGTAALSLLAFHAVDRLPELAQRLGAGWQGSLGANAALAGSVLLPATLCIGATFPFAVRVLARGPADASSASARVYAWNTCGAIAGAIGAGFFLIPAAGYAGSMAVAVAANLALAGAAAWYATPPARPLLALAALGAALLVLFPPQTPWRMLRSSPFEPAPLSGDVTYYAVGRSATVLLFQRPNDPGSWHLRTNGLPEASIGAQGDRAGRYPVNSWLSVLPALLRPEAKSLVVVGLGGGLALEDVPASFDRIEVVELEPEVVAANRSVSAQRRRDPLADPRLHIRLNDARAALLLTQGRFDAIVSQPSHPWTAGASHLYTREFFSLARDHLSASGVFVQWIGLSFVDEFLLRSLVATLLDVFPHVQVYRPEPGAVLFVASAAPLDPAGSADRALGADPLLYATLGLHEVSDVMRALVLDEQAARRFALGAPVNTDDHNFFETRSPAGLRPLREAGVTRLLAPFDPMGREASDTNRVRDVRRLLASGAMDRAQRAAWAMPDTSQRRGALALVERAEGHDERAAELLSEALRLDPANSEARWALLGLRRGPLLAGNERASQLAQGLDDGATAVVEGWKLESAGRSSEIEALEPRLASVAPRNPAFADALRLRATWRVASGVPARAREALVLMDCLAPIDSAPGDGLLRTRAAALAGYPRAALSAAGELASGLGRMPPVRARETAADLATLVDAMNVPPELAGAKTRLLSQLEATQR